MLRRITTNASPQFAHLKDQFGAIPNARLVATSYGSTASELLPTWSALNRRRPVAVSNGPSFSDLVVARLRLLVRDFASRSIGEGWWRGLDSNQRTLARADLQSAAFNHSATSPRGHAGRMLGRRAMWRRPSCLSTQVRAKSCRPFAMLGPLQNSIAPRAITICRPSLRSGAPAHRHAPGMPELERVKGIEPSS